MGADRSRWGPGSRHRGRRARGLWLIAGRARTLAIEKLRPLIVKPEGLIRQGGDLKVGDDVADRIVHLEDGKLSSFAEAVSSHTEHMMSLLADNNRKGDLGRRVLEMDAAVGTG